MLESYRRRKEQERKLKIQDDFIIAEVIAANVLIPFGDNKSELPHPWDYYPGFFQKEKELWEENQLKFSSGIPVLRRFTGGVRDNGNSFGSSVKNLLKYSLGIRSLFALVNKLRSALTDGFKNLSQYSGNTNNSLSMLMVLPDNYLHKWDHKQHLASYHWRPRKRCRRPDSGTDL